MRVVHGYARACTRGAERRGERDDDDDEHRAESGVCVVVPTRHQHSNPDDKGERVAGVRGQPGPVAGVRPISGRQPAGHRREIVREVDDDDCLFVDAKMLNYPPKKEGSARNRRNRSVGRVEGSRKTTTAASPASLFFSAIIPIRCAGGAAAARDKDRESLANSRFVGRRSVARPRCGGHGSSPGDATISKSRASASPNRLRPFPFGDTDDSREEPRQNDITKPKVYT